MSTERVKAQRKALPPSPDWVTIRDVAAYCCVSESAVSRGARNKTWPFDLLRRTEVGGRVLFTRASFNHMCRVMKRSAEALPGDVASVEDGRCRRA